MKVLALIMTLLLVSIATIEVTAQSPTPVSNDTDVTDEFASQGLDDGDLEEDVTAETLPTDGLAYRWERLRFGLRRAFIFNAEKKAALDREFLHRLDRKAAACAELGDEACVARVEAHIAAARARAEKFLQKREELRAAHLERFQQWRDRREARLTQLREKATERKENVEELRQQRQEQLPNLRQRRQEMMRLQRESFPEQREGLRLQTQEQIKQRQENGQQLQQNREHLIETRSKNVKEQLDATRTKVLERERQLTPQQAAPSTTVSPTY